MRTIVEVKTVGWASEALVSLPELLDSARQSRAGTRMPRAREALSRACHDVSREWYSGIRVWRIRWTPPSLHSGRCLAHSTIHVEAMSPTSSSHPTHISLGLRTPPVLSLLPL